MNNSRWGIFVAPHVGGIYSFYKRCHEALASLGIDACSIEVEGEATAWRDYDASQAAEQHQVIPMYGFTGAKASQCIVDWLIKHDIETIVLTPMTPRVVFDALPHMPLNIRVLVRLTEISHHSYRQALGQSDFIDGIITICPRQFTDIANMAVGVRRYALHNGVNTDKFIPQSDSKISTSKLKILFLDRMVDSQKRVLLIPKLCHALDKMGTSFTLTVAGDGPDHEKLKYELNYWIRRGDAVMLGRVLPDDVPSLMAEHDIYLKLSRNEGSPNAILEAMSSGLLPISTRISDVTDYVIEDSVSGYLVNIDDTSQVAFFINQLDRQRDKLLMMRGAARNRIISKFSMLNFSENLNQIVTNLPKKSHRLELSWNEWSSSEIKRNFIVLSFKKIIPLSFRVFLRERVANLFSMLKNKLKKLTQNRTNKNEY